MANETADKIAPDQWWCTWVRQHPVAGPILVGIIATHVTTMIGYYLVGIGLPGLPWADFNGFFLSTGAELPGTFGSFYNGFLLHTVDGIIFTLLFAAVYRTKLGFLPNTTVGNLLKGVVWGLILGLISIGFLIPYVYLRKNHPSGFGGGLGLFSFDGPDGWKLPFAVLLWHGIWGAIIGHLYRSPADK